jgi:hypothetical protein
MLLELLVFYVNTYQLGNSFSLWLGIQPADTFLYVFLPALLLESSCRLDFFLFKKFIVQVRSPQQLVGPHLFCIAVLCIHERGTEVNGGCHCT